MDLIEKWCDLLAIKIAFVAVRVYDAPPLEGTVMLVTKEDFFGSVADQKLHEQLIWFGGEALKKWKSEKKTLKSSLGPVSVFFEVSLPDETLLIAGAGHIAFPLCEMAKLVGFRVVIADDREDYANAQQFPRADQILTGPFVEVMRNFRFNYHTYVVLVTRGHLYDTDCLREILGKPVAYISMIGSMRRLKGIFHLLEKEGFARFQLAQVHGPIGLPIGAQTPKEIAVSIISEVIIVRYQGPAWLFNMSM